MATTRRLYIVGSGETAERLAELAGQLGYEELGLADDLPDGVAADDHLVIAEEAPVRARALLLAAARCAVLPAYLGYAAPHPEGWKALVHLAAGNIPKARLDAVSAPAGVDVGAETPSEVAISVAAELVAIRHGRRRPSAGLETTPARTRPPLELRPRRMIGVRPAPPCVEELDADSGTGTETDDETSDEDTGAKGRN